MFLSDKYLYIGTYIGNFVKKGIIACFVPMYGYMM